MHGWAELTEKSRNTFSSWPFNLLWEGFLFPYQCLHMEISEGPQRGAHIPKANCQTLQEDDKYQPQLGGYSWSLQQKAKATFGQTSSVSHHVIRHRPFENKEIIPEIEDGPAKSSLGGFRALKCGDAIEDCVQFVHMKSPGRQLPTPQASWPNEEESKGLACSCPILWASGEKKGGSRPLCPDQVRNLVAPIPGVFNTVALKGIFIF